MSEQSINEIRDILTEVERLSSEVEVLSNRISSGDYGYQKIKYDHGYREY